MADKLGISRYWSLLAYSSLVLIYTAWCPFTKVEESFNIQAVHDLIYHWPTLDKFDHHEFPGVVPRTFIGPIVIASITKSFKWIAEHLLKAHLSKLDILIVSRTVLGLASAFSWFYLQQSFRKRFGRHAANFFTFLSLSQFHPLFYASRTLPNTFALCLVQCAYGCWFNGSTLRCIAILSFTAAVFRFETTILLAVIILFESRLRRERFFKIGLTCLTSCIFSIALTISVDSYFWKSFMWPEAKVFYFNVILNKSSEWGTLPLTWYLVKGLPNLLLAAFPFVLLGLLRPGMPTIPFKYTVPSLVYFALFSWLPHKELRFMLYLTPIFNLIAADRIAHFWTQGSKASSHITHLKGIMFKLLATSAIVASFASSVIRVYISSKNYPGGLAMIRIHEQLLKGPVKLHIDVPTAMTGCSRFLEFESGWTYDKTENLSDLELAQFTHLLSDRPVEGFSPMESIHGFAGLKIQRPTCLNDLVEKFPCIQIHLERKLLLLERA